MTSDEKTNIQVGVDIRDLLTRLGKKEESYDAILRRLLSPQFPELMLAAAAPTEQK